MTFHSRDINKRQLTLSVSVTRNCFSRFKVVLCRIVFRSRSSCQANPSGYLQRQEIKNSKLLGRLVSMLFIISIKSWLMGKPSKYRVKMLDFKGSKDWPLEVFRRIQLFPVNNNVSQVVEIITFYHFQQLSRLPKTIIIHKMKIETLKYVELC